MRAMAAIAGERFFQRRRRDLAALSGEADEFQPAAEKFDRTAFVGRDVRFGMAQHDAPGRRDMRQRQSICGRAGRHQEYSDFALENLGKLALERLGPIVIAVA